MAAPSSTHFKKTAIRTQPQLSTAESAQDAKFWESFSFPITKKEYGPIVDVQFTPVEPYQYAVCSSARVQIYDCETNQLVKTFSKFKEVVNCARYRADGRLFVAGTEAGLAKVYDVERKLCLRMLKGHTSAIHSALFMTGGQRILTSSDDQSSVLWDLASGEQLLTANNHTDSVRCSCINPSAEDVILTGSYDGTAKLFDVRAQKVIQTVVHNSPIEDVLMFGSGTVYMTAGGTSVKVWDALTGGKLMLELNNHHKTVMNLTFNSDSTRFLTSGLDRHVKVYDSSTYQVVHTLDFPAPVLAVGFSGDDQTFAAGMADGMLSVRRRKVDGELTKPERQRKAFEAKIDKHSYKPAKDAHIIQHKRRERLAKYDSYLKSFQYSKTLDAVLEAKVRLKHPDITVSIMEELIRRDAIRTAVAGRDEQGLDALLRFLTRHITNPHFSTTIVDVANVVLDVYSEHPDRLAVVMPRLMSLCNVVSAEAKHEEQLLQVLGTMDAILSMSNRATVAPAACLAETPPALADANAGAPLIVQ